MNCQDNMEQLADWLNDNLGTAEKSEVDKHLVHCLHCREEFIAGKQLWASMNGIKVDVPGEAMKIQFNAMLDDFKESVGTEDKYSLTDWVSEIRKMLTPQLALQLAFSFLLVGLGWVIGYRMSRLRTPVAVYEKQIDTLANQVQEMRQNMMLALIENPSATERIRAVNYTSDISHANERVIEALITTLNNDSNVNVRLVTLEALIQYTDDPLVRKELVKSLAQQDSPMVQIALADLMVKLQEKNSVKAFRQLLKKQDLNKMVKIKIEQSIKDLS